MSREADNQYRQFVKQVRKDMVRLGIITPRQNMVYTLQAGGIVLLLYAGLFGLACIWPT